MSRYKALDMHDGQKYFSCIWNLFLQPLSNDNYFVEPWANVALRECATFEMGGGHLSMILCLSEESVLEHFAITPTEIYIYGAYNQIQVCQMRARGDVSIELPFAESKQHRATLLAALEQKMLASDIGRPSLKEMREALALAKGGRFFRFTPTKYALAGYERG